MSMTPSQVDALVSYSVALKPRMLPEGANREEIAFAWATVLDVRLDLSAAQSIVAKIVAEGGWPDPGSINARFLESIRPPHQQATGKARLIGETKTRDALGIARGLSVPAELGSGVPEVGSTPVTPQSVPEYEEWRKVEERLRWRSVPCPYCHANIDEPCTRPGDNKAAVPLRKAFAHPSRMDKVREARDA